MLNSFTALNINYLVFIQYAGYGQNLCVFNNIVIIIAFIVDQFLSYEIALWGKFIRVLFFKAFFIRKT